MTRLVPLVLAAALAACSGETGDPATDAGPDAADAGSTPDAGPADAGPRVATLAERRTLVDALIADVCAREQACCAGNESLAACQSRFATVFEPLATNAHIAVDLAGGEACRTLVAASTCAFVAAHGGIVPPLIVCEPFWTGTLANGAACGQGSLVAGVWGDQECASGSCNDDKCVALAGVDGPCSDGCQAGLECLFGKCRPQLAAEANCEQEGLCVDGLECSAVTPGAPYTCAPPKVIAAGAECEPGTRCALGNETCTCPVGSEGCLWGVCGDSSRCLVPG